MTLNQLFEQIQKKQSYLCVGLDTDFTKLPHSILQSAHPVFEFNRRIIDATADYTISYKPNLAFYEVLGIEGWICLEMTVKYIRDYYPEIFIIADAKRGDIGNTSKMYAKTFFESLNFDAVTLSPYMGEDSIAPFLDFKNKWAILLALTSNSGANDFQQLKDSNSNLRFFESVLQKSVSWGNEDNMMFVVGATKADMLSRIREIVPDHFLLIPGVGAQGGSLEDVSRHGFNKKCGLIVNSSRAIIYADSSNNFAEVAREKSIEIQKEMCNLLSKYM